MAAARTGKKPGGRHRAGHAAWRRDGSPIACVGLASSCSPAGRRARGTERDRPGRRRAARARRPRRPRGGDGRGRGARAAHRARRAQLPGDGARRRSRPSPIGGGRRVVHVTSPRRTIEGLAWEALLAAGRRSRSSPGSRASRAAIRGSARARPCTSCPARRELRAGRRRSRGPAPLRAGRDAARSPGALPGVARAAPRTAQRLAPEQQHDAQPVVATDEGPPAPRRRSRSCWSRAARASPGRAAPSSPTATPDPVARAAARDRVRASSS